MPFEPGARLGAYEILSLVGRGGMGEVYRARDTRLGRLVAIKVISPAGGPDAAARDRLEREARAISSLDHPNICALYDIGREGGDAYLVMQYLEGETLASRLHRGPLPLEEVRRYAVEIASALEAAHTRGIVHRDLKPGNIMLTAAGARLLDFGLAIPRTIVADTTAITEVPAGAGGEVPTLGPVTRTGAIVGTLHYIAPEQLDGSRGDGRSDIFSFGAVLYEMIAGRRAFDGAGDVGVITAIVSVTPPLPSSLVLAVPPSLDDLVMRCLAKSPGERFQSAGALVEALGRIRDGAPVVAPRAVAGWRRVAAAAAVGLALALAGIYAWDWTARPPGATVPASTTLAVLPIELQGDDLAARAYWTGLLDAVTGTLAALPATHGVHVIPSADVANRNVRTARDARVEVGATRAVAVTAIVSGNVVRATLTLVDTSTGQEVKRATVTSGDQDAAPSQNRILDAMVSLLDLRLTQAERAGIATPQAAAGAYDFYLQGLGYLLNYDKPENLDTAIAVFQHALEIDPAYALAHAGLGQAFWRKYQNTRDTRWAETARQSCERALGLDELEAAPHACLGIVANGTGQYEKGVEEFQHALAREPDNATAYLGLASAYRGLGQPQRAEETYLRGISLRPGYWDGYNRLGAFYYTLGRHAEAEQMFKQVVALTPDSWRGHSNLGALYYAQNRMPQAIAAFEKSLSIKPNYQAASNLGTLYYFEQQAYAKAAEAFKQAVSITSTEFIVWGNYAAALRWSGDNEGARYAFGEAATRAEAQRRVNPRDPWILIKLADYYANLGRPAEAETLIEESLGIGRADATLLYAAGVVHEALGHRDEAIRLLTRSVEQGYQWRELERSPSLAALRRDTRFENLRKIALARAANPAIGG